MSESTGKRQYKMNKDTYKMNVTKPKDEKWNPKHDMFQCVPQTRKLTK